MHPFILVISLSVSMTLVQGELTHLIESPGVTNWGNWGNLDRCTPETFVTGMQLKVEKTEGWKDDTGLNGIKFFCSKLGDAIDTQEEFTEVISSSIGNWGSWKSVFRCEDKVLNRKTLAVVGFQLKSEAPKGGILDDTSANNLRIFCSDFSDGFNHGHLVIEGDGTKWGDWSDPQICRNGYAICGIVTQVDQGRGDGYDDTSLNNIRAECCKIKLHNKNGASDNKLPSNPNKFPDPIESARALEREILRSIENEHSKNNLSFIEKTLSEPLDKIPRANFSHPDVLILIQDTTTTPSPLYKIVQQTTQSPPEISLDIKWSKELERLADLEFGETKIDKTIAIPSNETPVANISKFDAQPIVPPEVVQYLESDKNDQDPDPTHLRVIAGSIINNVTSTDVEQQSESTTLLPHTLLRNDPLASSDLNSSGPPVYVSTFMLIFSTVLALYNFF